MTAEQHVGALPATAAHARSGGRARFIIPAAVVVAAVVGLLAWRGGVFGSSVPQGIVTLSGRIEADDATVAPKTGGRILEVRVHEGDSVKAGDPIAVLDDEQVRAREEQATAALAQAEARTKAARDQITVLEEQVRQAQLQTEQSKVDSEGRVKQSEADLATAEAQLAREVAALQIAAFDKDAYAKLAKTGAASERQEKQAASTADQQAAAVAAAERRVEAARAAVTTARASLSNPGIREAQTATLRRQIAQQEADVASVLAQAAQMRAQLAEAQANRADLTVRAPFDGTVVTRSAEPGEIVMPGTPIVTLVDLTKVYLRGFVAEGRIGEIKVGQAARVYLDSEPDKPVDAYVSRIDPEATFTPENTYFREDRVKQVVGVKVQLKGAVGFAKPGMPADGEILVASAWPSSGRRS